jgi:hypothetical protein
MKRDEKVERKRTKRWKEREEKTTEKKTRIEEKYNKPCSKIFLEMWTQN